MILILFYSYLYGMKKVLFVSTIIFMIAVLPSCHQNNGGEEDLYFTNPIIPDSQSTAVEYHEGTYYYLRNASGHVMISALKDPSDFSRDMEKSACNMKGEYGLEHLWHPQLKRFDGKWYIYVTADNGDTDNHKMYVLENSADDPMEGQFTLKAKFKTDSEDNWAMHGNVFEHNGQLYMVWSGWENRRVYVEKQCIYIATMDTPWSLSCDRIMISEPEYEWELQWIQRDGSSSTRYPVFVNENPVFFNDQKTDKLHIFYSASANWTAYHCVGELTADKDADILDPASWTKTEVPVFKENREEKVFGPDMPYFIPTPDGEGYYMLYSANQRDAGGIMLDVYCQPIEIKEGKVELGKPVSRTTPVRKISSLH